MMKRKTYLLTWNPNKWPWDNLAEMAQRVQNGERVISRWSCGLSKKIIVGDRIFMMRQGQPPRGLFASAYVTAGSYEDLHWDSRKSKQGVTSQFVEIQFDHLVNPDETPKRIVVPREILKEDARFSTMHWDTQISGIRIPENLAVELEKLWDEFAEYSVT